MMAQKDQCYLKRSILLLTLLLEMRGMPHVRRQKKQREGLAKDFTGVPTRKSHGCWVAVDNLLKLSLPHFLCF